MRFSDARNADFVPSMPSHLPPSSDNDEDSSEATSNQHNDTTTSSPSIGKIPCLMFFILLQIPC